MRALSLDPVRAHVVIYARRIGFLPDSLGVSLPLAAPIDIELREAPQPLDTVNVRGPEEPIVRGKLAGFYERKSGCYPDVYLDGAVVYSSTNQLLGGGAASEATLFDVNLIDPGHVSALEFYAGPSQMRRSSIVPLRRVGPY